jgi:hypothetical protein
MNNHFNNITLDNKHNKIIKSIHKNKELIPKYRNEIIKLENQLAKLNNNTNTTNTNNTNNTNTTNTNNTNNTNTTNTNTTNTNTTNTINNTNNIFDINEKIKYYKDLIHSIENASVNYYLENSSYIFEYFEEKKAINTKTISTKNNDKIYNFFNLNSNISNYIEPTNINDNLLDKYFTNNIPNYLNHSNFCYHNDICKYCRNGEMIYNDCDGIYICNNCYRYSKYFIENDKTSYHEPPKEICFYAYKRINHLREILAQFQAKESTKIPEEIFTNIKIQLKKERIELSDLTNKKAKEILKNLGYNKYYEHIPFIKDKLGIPAPVMTNELEEILCNLFMEIQKPYAKFCPSNRVNFLNYYYTIYKLCELLKKDEFLPYFQMLKDREKRIEQDQIWKKICEELNWQFIPTV